jgi:hypothetical protein
MALKNFIERLRTPVDVLDRADLDASMSGIGCLRIDEVVPPAAVRVAGEVSSVRIVPRAGAPALEVSISDGRGSLIGVFLGRRKITGMSPGRRVIFEGFAAKHGNHTMIYNPEYRFIEH